jgi:hypothetical protein
MKIILPSLLAVALLLFSCADDEKLSHAAVAEVKASSFVVESVLAYGRYHPLMAIDGDPATAWNEAAKGPGLGEWIEIAFDTPITADAIHLMPGYYATQWYQKNNRIKSLEIALDGKTIQAELTDGMDEKTIKLEKETTFSRIRLMIKDIYKGTAYDDTCLAEISFWLHKRKIELAIDAPKVKLAEDDRQAQIASMDTPSGKKIIYLGLMGGGDEEYFFMDGVYVHCFNDMAHSPIEKRIVGYWEMLKNGRIRIDRLTRCEIIPQGESVDIPGVPWLEYYGSYDYVTTPSQDVLDMDWRTLVKQAGETPSDYTNGIGTIKPIVKGDERLRTIARDENINKSIADRLARYKAAKEARAERMERDK